MTNASDVLSTTYEIRASVLNHAAAPREIVEQAERAMLEVAHDDRQKDFRTIDEILDDELKKMEKLSREGTFLTGTLRLARPRRDKKGGPGSGGRKPCPYCKEKIEQADYKDTATLRKFISEKGKIRSRRITGACRRHQSQIARAVKRARELALLPYVNEGGRDDAEREGGGHPSSAVGGHMTAVFEA